MSRVERLVETDGQYCLACGQDKKGRFLLIFLDPEDVGQGDKKLFVAVCEDCVKRQPYDRQEQLKLVRAMGFYSDEALNIYDCVYSPSELLKRGERKFSKPFDRRIFKK